MFNFNHAADLFTGNGRQHWRQPLSYKRFSRAADAIAFAVEELSNKKFLSSHLQVDDHRFDGMGIRKLYDSPDYPLVRKPGISTPGTVAPAASDLQGQDLAHSDTPAVA